MGSRVLVDKRAVLNNQVLKVYGPNQKLQMELVTTNMENEIRLIKRRKRSFFKTFYRKSLGILMCILNASPSLAWLSSSALARSPNLLRLPLDRKKV